MLDIMLDLETLGTRPGCVIAQIGAVAFEEATITQPFFAKVDITDAQREGLVIEAETVKWWLKQEDGARAEIGDGLRLGKALWAFTMYHATITGLNGGQKPKIWGNGAAFDNVILRAAYEKAKIEAPWAFWDDRCFRTLKNLLLMWAGEQSRVDLVFMEQRKKVEEELSVPLPADAHVAINDALRQAVLAGHLLARLK